MVEQPCLFSRTSFSPRVTQLNPLQWLVLWLVPSWAHAPSTVLGLLRFEQTTLVWLVAELRCRDGSTCQSHAHHASISLGAPEPKRNDSLVLHKCGMSPHCRCFNQNRFCSTTEYSVCLCVIACPCCASWSWSLALPLCLSPSLAWFPWLGLPRG